MVFIRASMMVITKTIKAHFSIAVWVERAAVAFSCSAKVTGEDRGG